MTKQQLNTIADHLKAVPVDALQRASLLYAAKRLRNCGEAGTMIAVRLLEQMADEHYAEMTIAEAIATSDETVVVEVKP